MRVLVACEESQNVTRVFRALGHEAYSCDILPCSGGHPEWHIQEDVSKHIGGRWDMLIAFPPCTHLAASGAKHFAQKQKDGRQAEGIDFFMQFVHAPIPLKAIENPIGIMSRVYRKPDQIIHPWMFGHPTTKATCLWLFNLPQLVPTDVVHKGETITFPSGKVMSKWYYDLTCLPHSQRGKEKSKTFAGIASAMAAQWG
jgi:hypothetical protein